MIPGVVFTGKIRGIIPGIPRIFGGDKREFHGESQGKNGERQGIFQIKPGIIPEKNQFSFFMGKLANLPGKNRENTGNF